MGTEKLIPYTQSNYRDENLSCLSRIDSEFVMTSNDDYFFYGYANYGKLLYIIDKLKNSNYSFIRLHKGYNSSGIEIDNNLFLLNSTLPFYYTQGLTIWKKNHLEKLFDATPRSGIGRKKGEEQFELLANNTIKKIGFSGLYYYSNENKRGMYHYDCSILPHTASAIVDGKWNFEEYKSELIKILSQNNCKIEKRGKYSYSILFKIKKKFRK